MKAFVIIISIIMVLGFVYAFDAKYSEPTTISGHKIEWNAIVDDKPVKEYISKEEWNNIFEDYRNREISKENAIKILKGVEIKW